MFFTFVKNVNNNKSKKKVSHKKKKCTRGNIKYSIAGKRKLNIR